MNTVTLGGQTVQVADDFVKVGDKIESFVALGNDLAEVSLANFEGKRKILNIFPSIDTGICATSVRTFNQKANDLANTVVLCVSMDLPFAQARFCGDQGLENVKTLSLFRHQASAKNVGVLMIDGALQNLSARAVIVLDERNTVLHAELVPEIKQEPDYDGALAVLS